MSVISWFKATHSAAFNQVFLTVCRWSEWKGKLTPVSDDVRRRQNKEQIGYFQRSHCKKLIAECVFWRCCLSYRRDKRGKKKIKKVILSDRRADFEEHSPHKALSWLLLNPQSPTVRDLYAQTWFYLLGFVLLLVFFFFLNWISMKIWLWLISPEKQKSIIQFLTT